MVADLYSRRLSVILGLCIIGTGITLIGAIPTFWCIALGSVLWGVGGTFISGAHQAWLADEIGRSPGRASVSARDATQPGRRPRGDSAQRRPRLNAACAPLVGEWGRLLGPRGSLTVDHARTGVQTGSACATPRVAGAACDVACWPCNRTRACSTPHYPHDHGHLRDVERGIEPVGAAAYRSLRSGSPAALRKRPGLASCKGGHCWAVRWSPGVSARQQHSTSRSGSCRSSWLARS